MVDGSLKGVLILLHLRIVKEGGVTHSRAKRDFVGRPVQIKNEQWETCTRKNIVVIPHDYLEGL